MAQPYNDGRDKGQQVRDMFDNIAPAYDFMNRAMTFGIDRWWRRRAVERLRRVPHNAILDIATGTGDLAILMARRFDKAEVTGVDLSEGMLAIGRGKVRKAGLAGRVSLGVGDCMMLPFRDGTFDCVTCAYGVRNFADIARGYREMARVLRPGGTAVILELSTPTNPVALPLYRFYSGRVIPAAGRLMSHDVRAYAYLPESIAQVPQRRQMVDIMLESGFARAGFTPMTFGACTIYTARKAGG